LAATSRPGAKTPDGFFSGARRFEIVVPSRAQVGRRAGLRVSRATTSFGSVSGPLRETKELAGSGSQW
jgi:hypothetical protein